MWTRRPSHDWGGERDCEVDGVVAGAVFVRCVAGKREHISRAEVDDSALRAGLKVARCDVEVLPNVDTIVIAVGGGGLYAGIAAVARERGVRVVAVEPESIPTLHSAIREAHPVDVAVSGVAADSLGARQLGSEGFEAASAAPPVSMLVQDAAIIAARDTLWADYRMPDEHGAATAFAALSSGAYAVSPDERLAVIVCGANTDPTSFGILGVERDA